MTFNVDTQERRDVVASALAEYVADRYGETGHYFGRDDDGWRLPAAMLIELADAGAKCSNAAHTAYLVPACRQALKDGA